MKPFIITLASGLLLNIFVNTTLIGHFSLFYIQVMVVFVIEEACSWLRERSNRPEEDPIAFVEDELRDAIWYNDEQLDSDVIELGSILVESGIKLEAILSQFSQFSQVHTAVVYEGIGISWLVARGYTADRLDELKEDMPRILLYLKNVQTAKDIEAL